MFNPFMLRPLRRLSTFIPPFADLGAFILRMLTGATADGRDATPEDGADIATIAGRMEVVILERDVESVVMAGEPMHHGLSLTMVYPPLNP